MGQPSDTIEEFDYEAKADCCGTIYLHALQDGFDFVRVGGVVLCGECLVEAGVIEDEPE